MASMNKIIISLLPVLLFFSCSDKFSENDSRGPKIINPVLKESSGRSIRESKQKKEKRKVLLPMIDLPENEFVQQIQDINLDGDKEEEQIIITRQNNDNFKKFKLYVVDYDSKKAKYKKALESALTATQSGGLSINLQDITGNQQNELFITGFTATGAHTLDAFTNQSRGKLLEYNSILSIVVNGIIDIEATKRSAAYTKGQQTWESYNIITEESSLQDSNNLDLTKTILSWDKKAECYKTHSVITVPGVSIKKEKLRKLYRGNLDAFKAFLQGPWYQVSNLNQKKQPFLENILYFCPEKEQLIFSVDDIQEIYKWENTYRTIFKGIYVQACNSLINSLKRDIYITIEDLDSIKLKIQGTGEWGGFYSPVSKKLQKGLLKSEKLSPVEELMLLNGLFQDTRGNKVYLDFPGFIEEKTGEEEKQRGILSFFDLYGITILEMRYQDETGLLLQRSVYKVDYEQTVDSSRIIRSLTLQPGKLTASGFIQEPQTAWLLEQVEIREAGESEKP